MPPPDYVLIVEDNPDLAEVEGMMLESAGYPVATAENGRRALEVISERMPAVILLDMLMPVMDGWRFTREFRQRHGSAAPIVVVTAAECASERASEIGAEGVLAKPFDVGELLRVVERFRPVTQNASAP